jgi:hypothetical protein
MSTANLGSLGAHCGVHVGQASAALPLAAQGRRLGAIG